MKTVIKRIVINNNQSRMTYKARLNVCDFFIKGNEKFNKWCEFY